MVFTVVAGKVLVSTKSCRCRVQAVTPGPRRHAEGSVQPSDAKGQRQSPCRPFLKPQKAGRKEGHGSKLCGLFPTSCVTHAHTHTYIYIYIYLYVCVTNIYIYIYRANYIYNYREVERAPNNKYISWPIQLSDTFSLWLWWMTRYDIGRAPENYVMPMFRLPLGLLMTWGVGYVTFMSTGLVGGWYTYPSEK